MTSTFPPARKPSRPYGRTGDTLHALPFLSLPVLLSRLLQFLFFSCLVNRRTCDLCLLYFFLWYLFFPCLLSLLHFLLLAILNLILLCLHFQLLFLLPLLLLILRLFCILFLPSLFSPLLFLLHFLQLFNGNFKEGLMNRRHL